jgi:hypothetical protein
MKLPSAGIVEFLASGESTTEAGKGTFTQRPSAQTPHSAHGGTGRLETEDCAAVASI